MTYKESFLKYANRKFPSNSFRIEKDEYNHMAIFINGKYIASHTENPNDIDIIPYEPWNYDSTILRHIKVI